MGAQKSKQDFGLVSRSDASNTTVATTTPPAPRCMAQNYLLVWVDAGIHQTNTDCQNTLTQLRAVVNDITICTQPNECIEFLDKFKDENAFVITSGSLGQDLVPKIHGVPKLDAIYIFCGNISYHQQWAKDWNKIKGVHNNIKDICDALKKGVKQVNQDSISISFVAANETVSSQKLNQLEPNYMYTKIFKDILLEMEHDHEQARKDLADQCRKLHPDNTGESIIIDQFQNSYEPKNAIWWYTRECFTYQMLNRALRTLDADIIVNMGFFIHDLHQQIDKLHQEQLLNYHGKPFLVYRGQGLSITDFDKLKKTKGGLMSFNNFLSTSTKKDVSLGFAMGASGNKEVVGILFVMTIDPLVSSTPFASIKEVSYFGGEEEILFSMHTVFRIGAIKQMDNNDRLYEVELQLTADDDEQLRQVTKCINKEVANGTGWNRLGNLLVKTSHFHKAEELYEVLLGQSSSESDKALYYNNLATVKNHQGNYEQAIEYYEKALEIQEKTLPANHSDLATSYNNIGNVYEKMGEYSKTLLFYEKALGIWEKTLPANHSNLATSYNNTGSVYEKMGEYSKALSFYEKALGIQGKTLPANHPSLATSYHSIGSVYNNMGEYTKALLFYEKALGILEKTLPANHPNLAQSYNDIGSVYGSMGQYPKALSFYEKALGIREKTPPANHPSLAQSYNNISGAYYYMGEYSKALSFYEKAFGIWEETLPVNHPDLAVSYSNVGEIYRQMGECSKALSFYEKAVGIQEKTHPANHPSLAASYNNIGELYRQMGECSKALSFYEKTLRIQEKTLPADQSDFAVSYNNLGCVYYDMKEYSKALSYFQRALDIFRASLPPNHPHIKAVKAWIKRVKQKL
ncbi:unnamed protein product [Adineta steineri]|uniref:ADP ribosyltransferase domain-containing protein n=1 Tax=Adineta steineri TaxID=433720 RepID=A0A815NL32_9BILA|nr:unnamed protein product [Adineta steineri]CAF4011049.1 unnamed protein product [Adineta steineri]CAF4096663.1 unnamed protein product [Adineta steineri]